MQGKTGKFSPSDQPLLVADSDLEDNDAKFFDSDGDGDLDLIVGRGGNMPFRKDKGKATTIYLNNGKGTFSKQITLPLENDAQVSTVEVADFNGDSLPDLMMGGRNVLGKYGQRPRSYLLKNLGNNQYADVTKETAPGLDFLGMVKDATWTDLNQDGLMDLIVVGEWMPISIFINKNGKLINETVNFGLDKSTGWWNSVAVGDFNGDWYSDLVLGNLGLNSRLKTQGNLPVKMMIKDFDQNGSLEQILSYPENGNYYTVATKDELVKQIPVLKKDFVRYQDFSGKTVDEVFRRFDIQGATQFEASQFESVILVNQGGNGFQANPLPAEAQFAPIEAILVTDVDQDGHKDLILGGNNTSAAPYYGAYLGSWGSILLGNGLGDFKVAQSHRLKIKGEVKAIEKLTVGSQIWVVFAKNNLELEVVRIDF